jgi:hypothetical protein
VVRNFHQQRLGLSVNLNVDESERFVSHVVKFDFLIRAIRRKRKTH